MTAVVTVSLLALLGPSDPVPFVITPPALVLAIDGGQLHGTPIQLSWSPDSASWYLETIEGDGASLKHHRFLVAVGDRAPRRVEAAPPWAVEYWTYKSNRAVPAHPLVMIAVDEAKRTNQIPSQSLRQKAAGMENGAIALQGAFDANNDFANAARILTLLLDGKPITVLVDEPLVPGMTFGWSPKEYDSVAFRNEHHHGLSVRHMDGTTIDVPETRDILLPAWSPDGTRIVFLEQTAKKKYELREVTVALP